MSSILLRPIITEKTIQLASRGQYSFVVDKRANKLRVAAAIHEQYQVDVRHVTVQNIKPTPRRTRRGMGMTSGWKRAIATLKPKQSIPGFEIEKPDDAKHEHTDDAKATKGRS